jgi:hypothetical protein
MSTQVLEAQGSVDARSEESVDQTRFWTAMGTSRAPRCVTVAVSFQQPNEDNSDILRSREVEQEVLDMLDG